MTHPIEILMAEHRLIWEMLDVLEGPVGMMGKGRPIPVELLKKALDFISVYADEYHHVREEGFIIPMMRERHLYEKGGTVDLVLQEHRMARFRTARSRELIDAAAAGDEAATGELVKVLRSYITLVRCHIGMEDRLFFVKAAEAMHAADRQRLVAAMEADEQERFGYDVNAKYREVLEESKRLADTWMCHFMAH